MIFYILFLTDFVDLKLVDVTSMSETSVFGIGFLAGFSERLVFPELR